MITGNGTNTLRPGEVLRAVDLPGAALAGRTAVPADRPGHPRRSGAVVTGRADGRGHDPGDHRGDPARWCCGTRATRRRISLAADVAAVDARTPIRAGPADWRRQVSGVLLDEIRQELRR
ncbi:MAG: hypothetical protein U0R72_08290 [Nakamurella multipartita]